MLSKLRSSKKLLICMVVVVAMAAVVAIVGCAPKANPGNPTPSASSPTTVPEVTKNGVIYGAEWESQYPNQVRTWQSNDENLWLPKDGDVNEIDKLVKYPEIKVLGLGYGYAKFYTEPAGHTYSLFTVTHQGRATAKAKTGCIACKSAEFNYDVAQSGDSEIWSENFWQYVQKYEDNITCANCHDNEDPSVVKPTRLQWIEALGDGIDKATASSEACGQCHCDYSMDPVTGRPTSPYDSLDGMTPEKALQWYDEHNYVDWTYATTGAKMLAVRHSEFEYNYGPEGGHMGRDLGYDCADCHMAVKTADDGTAYHSHYWGSPLDNQELINTNCSTCHADIKAEVAEKQKKEDAHRHEVGMRAADFIHNFEDAIAAGTLTDEQVARLQKIQRDSAFYWNSVAAENSKGAHNTALYESTLQKAEELLNEGDMILGKASTVEGFQAWADAHADELHSKITDASLAVAAGVTLPQSVEADGEANDINMFYVAS
ncbi:ammonia-forming cytochrome c nitrite reductase subunit c552 [Curtanaerobium respiraculi]|uniref:ammonia-forming cytochrome c nitrite reductase subunit c552 n=1 Tax=Curtanaerobium respiraculi TaxID=2949669 RepID=UPI0024B3353A|nr:ammonia-forming cytochrome c nitrite reductase subunit c552 [Curtanaerobium respiraculi]